MKFRDAKIRAHLAARPGALPDERPGLGAGLNPETAAARAAWLAANEPSPAPEGCPAALLELEEGLLPVLADMEARGIRADLGKLAAADEKAGARAAELLSAIRAAAGEDINPASPKDLQRLLFEKMGLEPVRKTKTGFSVDEETLEEYAAEHAVCRDLLELRKIQKIRSTYLAGLRAHSHPGSGRVHTTFSQTRVSTGRLSSEEPNLQNIPRGGELADAVKSAFVPGLPVWKLVVADYSQVELRVLANMAGDAAMCARFRAGEDIHEATARAIFPGAEITREMRQRAKTVNFGVVYGQTPFGLSRELGIPPKEAAAFIAAFFAAYPGIRPWFDSVLGGARKDGFVSTWFGRRRPVPGVSDANAAVRARAEREACNMPVQGTAADVMKIAMVRLDAELRRRGLSGRMLLQVHDELVLECPAEEAAEVAELTRAAMEGAAPAAWAAPLPASVGIGDDWLSAKP